MKPLWRTLAAVVLALACITPAHALISWNVAQDTNCTAIGAATGLTSAPVACCTAAGRGFCDTRQAWGSLFVRPVTFTALTGGTYTTGGDQLSLATMQKIGIGQVVNITCGPTRGGRVVEFVRNVGSPKLRLFYGDNNNAADGPLIEVPDTTSITNESINCIVYGYADVVPFTTTTTTTSTTTT